MTALTPLTGQTIIDAFEEIISDSLDPVQELFILNMAKDAIEQGRDWNFNRGYDASQSVLAGDTYLSTKTLPSDFMTPRALYVQDDIVPFVLIGFEERERYKDIYKRYYIDYLSQTFALCGANGSGKAIKMFYGRATPDITVATSPLWPAPFHKILPFQMAAMWQSGSEADDINRAMAPANYKIAADGLKSMVHWDGKIKTREYNAKNERSVDLNSFPNIVGGEFLA